MRLGDAHLAAVDVVDVTVALRITADMIVDVGCLVRGRIIMATPAPKPYPGPSIACPNKFERVPLRPDVLVVGIQIDAGRVRLAGHVEVLPHRARAHVVGEASDGGEFST